MFKKLKTDKKKITVGVITGVITLGASFSVLVSVFGLDNLLSAIINPITKSKEITVTVNEEIELIETWDGDCSVTNLTPSNIFEGGTGTESDPYQIKTAEQLSCFARSVNNGETYQGKYIIQTKNIKLNDDLNGQAATGNLTNANVWISAGNSNANPQTYFAGTYDGDNHKISGLYITNDSNPNANYRGMFGYTVGAEFKNMILSDVYMNTSGNTGGLVGSAFKNLSLDNITTYGKANFGGYSGGLVSYFNGNNEGGLFIEDTTNNMDLTCSNSSGIVHYIEKIPESDTPNLVIRNVTNNGNITYIDTISSAGGIVGTGSSYSIKGNTLVENAVNKGNITTTHESGKLGRVGGIAGDLFGTTVTIKDSYNTGNWSGIKSGNESGGLVGGINTSDAITVENCYNSGDIVFDNIETYKLGLTYEEESNLPSAQNWGGLVGVVSSGKRVNRVDYPGLITIRDSYNTGDILTTAAYSSGIIGTYSTASNDSIIENCFNTGEIAGKEYVGGITGYTKKVTKSYNTGTITLFGSVRAGGVVGYQAQEVTNSYNLGDIIVTSKSANGDQDGGMVGGVCSYCNLIKNSYNRGNIIAKYNGIYIGGVIYSGTARNCYNSGNIIFDDLDSAHRKNISIGGITAGGSAYNSYNLGNLTVKIDKLNNSAQQKVCGISAQSESTDSVNKGNITLTFSDSSYVHGLEVFGISYGTAVNNFNAGTISFGDYPVITNVSEGVFTSEINMSNNSSSGNKFKNPNGIAIGCIGYWNTCTNETALEDGEYTTNDAPDVISVINGDNAFEILESDTLPTLKVFNN